jgi:hypothetical protein
VGAAIGAGGGDPVVAGGDQSLLGPGHGSSSPGGAGAPYSTGDAAVGVARASMFSLR